MAPEIKDFVIICSSWLKSLLDAVEGANMGNITSDPSTRDILTLL